MSDTSGPPTGAAPGTAHRAGQAVAARRTRRLGGLALLVLLLFLAVAASVLIGARTLGPATVWLALTGTAGSEADIIVNGIRLPRTVLGLLAGVSLGLSGALMQGHTRNPLGDPSILGVTFGAALAVVLGILVLGVTTLSAQAWFAFAGAAAATVLVYVIGSVPGRGPTPVTLALAGTAVSWLAYSLTSGLVLLDQSTMENFRFWRVGSLVGRDPSIIPAMLPVVAIGALLALANARALNALALGEDTARALGFRIGPARATGLVAITLLTGITVAACGPIAFVGLIVPHLARGIVGADYRWLLPYSALMGAILLLTADVLGRFLAPPGELQVGVVLALIGAPFFVHIVRRRRLLAL
ncbi:iron chelate uptake ABC transporter family permease subunit [Nocardiopsis sp. CT-R113]|uniref:Iron chelate uptake ABC transporter family permease subunit n=1 Tax=Nocardiopsis codii TaxID=3065942 RepID=A0ABU7KCD4_9ACTN|nr:iron chelate uptake ABC transporter family permease subunit [Nocardiopsis sp. CT-R113]MEE2039891.1 iron chelate uptake ABC transporter family permease subunit [Nocardiopsis sp. CT-R113]